GRGGRGRRIGGAHRRVGRGKGGAVRAAGRRHPHHRRAHGVGALAAPGRRGYNRRAMDLLSALAASQPDKAALIDDRPGLPPRLLTYAGLEAMANRLVAVLVDHGAGPGTKVVWCGRNSIGAVTLMAAARKLGVVAVPLNYRLAPDEAAYVTDHSDAEL